MSISATHVALAVAFAISTFASHCVELGALGLALALARPTRPDVDLRRLEVDVAHKRQSHGVVPRVRLVVHVPEVNLVAPVDVLVENLVLFLILLLRTSDLPRPHVQRRPQDLHGLLRAVLFAQDFLNFDYLLLQNSEAL